MLASIKYVNKNIFFWDLVLSQRNEETILARQCFWENIAHEIRARTLCLCLHRVYACVEEKSCYAFLFYVKLKLTYCSLFSFSESAVSVRTLLGIWLGWLGPSTCYKEIKLLFVINSTKKKFSLETKKKHLRNRFVKNLLVDSCYRLLCSCQLSECEAPAVKASQIVTIPKIWIWGYYRMLLFVLC